MFDEVVFGLDVRLIHMERHERADAVGVTAHDASWSANLETDEYAGDEARVVADAIVAVESTRPGFHVNLVTHGANGHPETYLYEALDRAFGDAVDYEFVDQCGCGGYVTRVRRLDERD